MASSLCGILDEKFLINFSIPIGTFSISDMMLVDRLLSDRDPCVKKSDTLRVAFDDDDSGPIVDIRVQTAAEHSSSSAAEHSSSLSEAEQSLSPEVTRYLGGNNEDLYEICSQRRRSTFCGNSKLRSTDQENEESNAVFNELSPIMKELDNTLFGNETRCELGTTFDTFGSPTWLNHEDDSQDLLQNFNFAVGNENCASSPRQMTRSSEHLPDIDNDDCCELDMFARLSINIIDGKESTYENERNPKNERNIVKKLLRKGPRMKQTTVTFFYDSDEEIKECSESDSQEHFDYNSHQKSCKFGFRNALGLTKKNGGYSDKGRLSASTRSSCVESCSATVDEANSRNNHVLRHIDSSVFINAGLQGWMNTGLPMNRFESIVVCCKETRKSAIKTMIESSIGPPTGHDKGVSSGRNQPHKKVMRKLPNFIRSEGLLIVTVKSQIEEWAQYIRSLPEPRLLLYSDTLAKRRKCGAHNVAQYDVVITTFEILRAKEVCIPEEYSSEDDSDGISEHDDQSAKMNNENKENVNMSDININGSDLRSEQMTHIKSKIKRNSDPARRNIHWIANRKNDVLLERSNLHLIHWRDIIVDFHDVTNIRTDTARGVAARALSGSFKHGLILSNPRGIEGKDGRQGKEGRKKGEGNGYEGFDSGCSDIDSDIDSKNSDASDTASATSPSSSPAVKARALTLSAITNIGKLKKRSNGNRLCGKIVENVRGVLGVPLGIRDRDLLFDARK